MSNKIIGEFIKHLRITQNISTSEIAKNLTISEAEYIKCESGEASIYVDDFKNIADMLSVEESVLIEKLYQLRFNLTQHDTDLNLI